MFAIPKVKPVPKNLGPLALWYFQGDYVAQVEAKRLANQAAPHSFTSFGLTSKHSGQFFKGYLDHMYEMVPLADSVEGPLAELGLVCGKLAPSAVIFITSTGLDMTVTQQIRQKFSNIFNGTKLILYSLPANTLSRANDVSDAIFDDHIRSFAASDVDTILRSLPSTTSVNAQALEQYFQQKVASASPPQEPRSKQCTITIASYSEYDSPTSRSFTVPMRPSDTIARVEDIVRAALEEDARKNYSQFL